MKLNEESMNQLNRVINKQYYLWLDENDRLTLTLTEEKELRECVGITMDTINKLMSQHRGTDLQSLDSEANSRTSDAHSGAGEKGRL